MSYEHEWLDLIDISGPFLAVPVLKNAFPQGLDQLDPKNKKIPVRQAYDEWREALDEDDPDIAKFHTAWVDLVLKEILELDEDGAGEILKPAATLPEKLSSHVLEHGITLQPDYAVIDDQHADTPLMLIKVYKPEVDLSEAVKGDGWASTPADRMVQLCRDTGTRLGIVTNGEQWMFVDAPVGAVTSFATWYARLWSQEPETLQAFISLFGVRRFFLDKAEQLPALLDQSLQYQDEVTEALGDQVRRAVEVLIQALDKANTDDDGKLLAGIEPRELYEAGLTVMMRLVFLLSAEERELLLLGDERYDTNYAVSTLRMQLRAESDEILDRRWDAWSRLLATFRAVYGGIEHETLRIPALGGSLFDPDRFPFLEGRAKDSNWEEEAAHPLPINNHTVLLLLDAIQLYQGRTLSYRGLDIEQLGYVYEGLLDHTVKRAREVTLELNATTNAKQPWVTIDELTAAKEENAEALVDLLKDRTGSSVSRVRNDLKKEVSEEQAERLLTSCQNDPDLREQLKPYFHLIRPDSWGYPLVYPQKSFMVTTGEDRRQTGSHYTPVSLTEAIVRETLEPVVYFGPAEGKPKKEWRLKSPTELLDLKICDPAMGSGAFLVQVCRWLGERVVESWVQSEETGKFIEVDGKVLDDATNAEPLPKDLEERAIIARRLIAERCIYGVDLNPLAVELAKLSVWLVTMAKGRPFGFLDHNLKCGDSLLGIHDLDQLLCMEIRPYGAQQKLFAKNVEEIVAEVITLRDDIRKRPIKDIRDVRAMSELDAKSRRCLQLSNTIADILIGESLASRGGTPDLVEVSVMSGAAVDGDVSAARELQDRVGRLLSIDLPEGKAERRPFHWALEFPEVFNGSGAGFDAIIGNPPFLGGGKITGVLGTAYREYLVEVIAEGNRGSADFVTYFFLRSIDLLADAGCFGLLAVNTIAQGDTRQVGLERMLDAGHSIISAYPDEPWPGKAAVVTSRIHMKKGPWNGRLQLNGNSVNVISAFLSDQYEWTPVPLSENAGKSFNGSKVYGQGFLVSESDALGHISKDSASRRVLFPYINGDDINSHPEQKSNRWAINFWDWPIDRDVSGRWSGSSAKQQKEWLKLGHVPSDFPGSVASDFPELLAVIESQVKPERQRRKTDGEFVLRSPMPQRWWQYGEKRPALYHAIGKGRFFWNHPKGWNDSSIRMAKVIVIPETTKYCTFHFCSTDVVLSHMLKIIALNGYDVFTVLVSTLHEVWARKQSSTLETRLKYNTSDAFETFPFPSAEDGSANLLELGMSYDECRRTAMNELQIGITALYNRFHDSSDKNESIASLRKLHRQIDEEVLCSYKWSGLELAHDFYEVPYLPANDRTRYTISEPARLDILRRLSALNKERFESENASRALAEAEKIGWEIETKGRRRNVVAARPFSARIELKVVSHKTAASSNLVVDAVYESSSDGLLAGEPISKLLPGSGNMGGSRDSGKGDKKKWVILFSTGEDRDWPDTLDFNTGQFVYYGDNKTPGHELHDTRAGGNKVLRRAFERVHADEDLRSGVSPFFVFKTHPTTSGSRPVQFKGLAVPGYPGLSQTEDLVAVWKTSNGQRFQNYRSVFTILDIPVVNRAWLHDLAAGNSLTDNAPKAWCEWVKSGKYSPLTAEPTTIIRSINEQSCDTSLKSKILGRVWQHFKDAPIAFESFAARIFQMTDQRVIVDEVTRGTIDGGRDAYGRYLLGMDDDPVYAEFSLEAKCYRPPLDGQKPTTVGVNDVSRLISRIRHRQFGILVTTSVIARQAYQEVREDRHPIIFISGRDIAEILIKSGYNSPEQVENLLNSEFPI